MHAPSRILSVLLAASFGCSSSGDSTDAAAADAPAPDASAPVIGACPADRSWPFQPDPELYPFVPRCFPSSRGVMTYVDEGPRDARETVLMLHGNPTWSALYRQVIRAAVADGHRVIAPDMLGYGLSDRGATADAYTPDSQSRRIEELVVALDLRNVTLVVQDWGGPVGLGMASRQPDRIARLLIMNTWAWPVSGAAPADFHRLVDWSNLAHAQEETFVRDCTMPIANAREIAPTVDSTGGPLALAVQTLYTSPFIDPATSLPRSPESCRPTMVLAKSILDASDTLREVESGLARLRGKPTVLVFGRADGLFGELRCDVGTDGVGVCPAGHACACDIDFLRPGESCSTGPMGSRSAWTCRNTTTERAPMPAVERFVDALGAESIVAVLRIKNAGHFIQEAAPLAVIEGLRALIAERPPAEYGPDAPSSPGGFCDHGDATSYWPDAPSGRIYMLNAIWYEDGGQSRYRQYGQAVDPLISGLGAFGIGGPASLAASRVPSTNWRCKDGIDPRAVFQLDADRVFFVDYPSMSAFDGMYYSQAYRDIANLRCDNAERALLIPCAAP